MYYSLRIQIPRLTGTSAPGVVLYLSDGEAGYDLSAADLIPLFGLTLAEARLAAALCQGSSVNDYAFRQEMSTGTVRTQLKSIFSKTGVNRQPDLVRLICSSVVAKTQSLRKH